MFTPHSVWPNFLYPSKSMGNRLPIELPSSAYTFTYFLSFQWTLSWHSPCRSKLHEVWIYNAFSFVSPSVSWQYLLIFNVAHIKLMKQQKSEAHEMPQLVCFAGCGRGNVDGINHLCKKIWFRTPWGSYSSLIMS